MKRRLLIALLVLVVMVPSALGEVHATRENPVGDCPDADCLGGGSGCDRCVIGMDNVAYCKDANAYQAQWPLKSNCGATTFCWTIPGAGTYCEPGCTGSDCYWV